MDPEVVQVLTTQLSILNERSRWYTARLWQIPFAFIGLSGYAIFNMPGKQIIDLDPILLFSGCTGFLILLHMRGLSLRIRQIVGHMRAIEEELRLEKTAGYFRTLSWPLFIILFIFSFSCLAASPSVRGWICKLLSLSASFPVP